MNKNTHRLVYSRLRGMVVAVAETATAEGKSATGEARARRRSSTSGARVVVAGVAALGMLPTLSDAQIVPTPGTSTHVIQTPNGLPQVNVAAPSGAGVSVNTYNQFDVSRAGAILNNSATMVQTQQAGWINGNPNFSAGQAARIIVNQVNSPNPSQIRGALEIAGSRAELVLANPSGIYLDGASFINTSRATLTTGVPYYGADGSLAGYNVNRGLVTVAGAGLNAANIDQVDLIARAVQVNAAVYAKNLNVIAGAAQVNHDTLAATPIAGDGPAPSVAIDVSQLGGMYSNRIFLASNENGVGVGNAGTIAAQAGDLTLQSNGRLVLTGKTTASGNLALSAVGGIQNSGTTYAQQSASINTAADVTNTGTLAAQQNTTVNAGSVNSTGTLGAGVNNDGSVGRGGDLNVTASGQLSATGQNVAGGNASLTGGNVNLAGGQTAANGNLSLNATAGDVNLSNATTSAQGAIQASASGTVINDHGSLSSGGSTTLSGGNLSNQGGKVSSQGPLSVHVTGQVANQSGELVSESTADVRGGAIANNQGTIQSAGHASVDGTTIDNTAGRITSLNGDGLSVTTSGQLTNAAGTTANGAQGGVIGGNGDVSVRGANVVNRGAITSNTNLRVAGQSVDNGSGTLQAAQNVVVDAGAHLANSGGSIVGQTATLSATTLDNSAGTVQADQVSLNATDVVNHGGTITQTGAGAMAVNVSGTLDNSSSGTLQTNSTDLTLAPATLKNDGGTITHAGTGTLTLGNGTGTVSNVGGSIASNGRVVAQNGTLNNASGSISAQNGLAATVAGTLNNASGKLLSNTDLSVTSGTLVNDSGQIGASTNATIHTGSMTNQGGSIVAPNLSVTADSTLDNSGGKLEANQLALTAANLPNHGGTITQYGSSAMGMNVSGTLDNSAAGVIQTNSTDLTLTPAELNNAGGTITHAGAGTLTIAPGNGASALNNAAGTIVTKGQAIVNAATWNNASGILAAQRGINAAIAGDVNNAQGLLRSDASLSLKNGGALSNRGGHIQAGQSTAGDTSTLAIQSASIDNADGAIVDLGAGKMTVQGGSQIANSRAGGVSGMGAITGNGDVTIGAASIGNTQGGQLSGASLHVQGNTLDNSGGTIGNVTNSHGDVDVTTTGAITNTGGQISSTHDLSVAAATLQGGGTYSATHDANVNLQGDYTAASDTQFNVGHDLAFTLPGTFTNNANLQSVNNLSVNAGNIVNVGALTAGGLLHTQSTNLTNTGALVGASVSLNATNTISNLGPTALIGGSDSNGTLEILARDIENRDDTTASDSMATTAIFGMGKVVLAGGKDASGNYTNAALVNNVSALIQSGGDMELHADKVTSTRRAMKTSTSQIDPASLAQFGIPISGRTGQIGVKDPDSIGGVYTEPPHGGQWNSTYQFTTYYADSATATTVTDISPAAQIVSGGRIDASSVGTLQNYWSNIAAVGDIKMPSHYDADGWAASGQKLPGVSVSYSGQYHYNNYDNSEHDWQLPFGNAPFVTGRPGGYTQAAPASIKDYTLPGYFSTLSSNGTISGTGVSVNNTAGNASIPSLGLLPGQSVPGLTPTNLSGNASGAKSGASAVHGGPPAPVDPIIASATALNVLNNLTIPQGGLFKPTTAPNASYVIETNPAFTNQKNFISSDYFFGQLGVDLTHIPKRLGDGFYEQQLVRNEVTALTGKAVLGPYADLQTMYQSLMAAGADLSKSLDLPIGASLSADQVSKLTSNVVMMETRVVDGQSVLVPVVYLAKASQQNIDGPLISATNIDFQNAQSFTNSGTIKADNTLAIQGKQIDNAFGALQSGGLMSLKTENNIDLTSANVKAGSLQLDAGNDLILDTATKTNTRVSRDGATSVVTTLGPTAKLDVAGNASIVTGGNFQQNAGNLSVGGNLGMNVGGNWDLGAVQTGEHKIVQRANGVSNTDINKVTGSSVTVGGQSSIGVGGDLTAKGAQIDLGQGGTIAAKGNVTLGAASATSTVNSNSSGSDSHGSYAETLHTSDQALTGTMLKGGDTVNIVSGKDITLSGSSLSLDKGNANLLAAGDVNVGAATETHELNSHETHSHSNVVSGVKVASGIDQTMTLNRGSLVSADGVNIVSGKDVYVGGSTIVGTNDVTLTAARNVTVTTSLDTLQSSSYYDKKESGLMSGGGLSVSIGSSSLKTTSQTSEVSNNSSTIGSLKGNVSITAGNDLHVTGSDLIAAKNLSGTGANVTIDAAQDTNHRGETQEVSKSGLTLALKAPVIDAVSNAVGQSRASSNSQDGRAAALHGMAAASAAWDANLAAGDLVRSLGAGETPQFKVEVSVGSSHSRSAFSEDSVTNRGSNVNAGGTVAFAATGNGQPGSGNVTIAGSNVNANDVILAAKNQVNIVNTTDTDSTRSTNESKSASVGVSFGTGGFGISAAMSKANGDGNSDLATQNNSHVNAANGVTIISGGDTNIIGSNVKGNQVNADVGGNLNIASVQDTMSSAAHQSSSGGGFSISQGGASASFSQSKGNASGSYAGVNEQAGIQAGEGGFNINVTGNTDLKGALIASSADASKNSLTTGSLSFSDIQNQSHYDASSSGFSAGATTGDGGMNYSTHGSTSGKNAGGAAPMLGQNDSGSDSATTKSGVSVGAVTITDSANQKQDVASLNRDTTNTNGTVAKLPDMQNLLANQSDMMAAASAAGEAVSRRIGDYADEMKRQAQKNGDQAGVDAWKEGGANRALMQGAGAALVTGLAGGNAVGGAAGAAIASIASGKLNELSSAIAGSDPTGNANMNQALGNIVANALATGAGAAVGGEAGAFSGYNVDRFNRQLHPEEKQVIKDLANGDPTKQHKLEAAGCALVRCSAEYAVGTSEYNQYVALEQEGRGYVAEQAQLKNYATTFLSAGSYGGMVKQLASGNLFQYSSQDAQADFATLQSGLSARRTGSFDYLSVQGSALGLGGSLTINLHNGNTYLSVGGAVPVVPGISLATGMVASNAGLPTSQRGNNTDNFLSGASIGAGACMFGVCAGVNHAIGGDTAFEIGIGAGGVTKVPGVGGALGVGYGGQIGKVQ
ncbi:hemagglutinin repeat-containing protein [Burkholderia contaminans]|uniref:Hemagglutinin repeat-containing protein n=10 Tax=Burkholderia TaxID=32008 RepID=A0AAP4VI15_9BURK|nr:contact-dependent inhibition toxin BcpA [Burkholderia contaminans]MBH9670994.1 hemagglutinin repeat-containing protein [Burkholderia contaminans]MBH9678072.1 hemagglutinin repeat-containing protein [Burkholderia contaminans]MBH9708496.1 hemagglutinin repeat-containing protein [Burkholderia contaminans]MBH9722279.1 hemagglutinin repeat-containing protein [Burkholderia contaminans]MBM6426258.1 hemagglutinin repeat-containing protein [Burkholderia contaminans]